MTTPANHPAAAYPTWLAKPEVPVTVVCGPPGNGAAAYIAERAHEAELVLDVAAIIAELSGVPSYRAGPDWIIPALERRNAALDRLGKSNDHAACWLISPAPFAWQRAHWQRYLGAEVVLLDPGIEAALLGARDEGVQERWVHQWYAQAATTAAPPAQPATRERANSHDRGYGSDHRRMRDRQLAREPWCRFCWEERRVKVRATVLDHIEPFRTAAGEFIAKLWGDPKNQRSLCQPCHDARGATRSRPEKVPGAGVDGRPLDAAHPWNRTS